MRIIFMGTPEFALPALEALIATQGKGSELVGEPAMSVRSTAAGASQQASTGAIEIVAVYSQPPRPKGRGQKLQPSPVQALAERHGIPVYTPNSLKSAEVQAEFSALKADIAVVVAYGLLLPQAILDAPTHGCINIHPSSLPRWRGAAPIQRSIMAGDTTTDICIMQMDAGLDTGDVYLRSAPIAIAADMDAGQLHDLLAAQSANLLLQTLHQLGDGTAKAIAQAEDGVTYADKISKEHCRIDWSLPAAEIHDHIRGLSPFPGAWTMLNCDVLKVFEAKPCEQGEVSRPSEPGDIINTQLTVACGDGAIQLLTVQKPGKPRMATEAFLRGHPVAKGAKLG